jgi:pimeloyl-ACP methyl ester carboxylesterase
MAELTPPPRRPISAPSQVLQAMEAAWLPLEAAGFLCVRPLLRRLGAGDQHPVLLLPGFWAGDQSTAPLRWTLRSQGYWAHSWHLGQNIGPSSRVVTGMRDRIIELHELHGRTVTLIGQSLGGIYARLLAREQPENVRQVITLGSPYRMVAGDHSSSSAETLWELVRPLHDGDLLLNEMHEQHRPPLVVPATSIYTRTDGVAPWQACIDEVREHAENIEVLGSHIGMAINPAVVVALLDRLAQPEGDWRPFAPPFMLRPWYPRPAGWHERRPPRHRAA